jgi:hypothetical protein
VAKLEPLVECYLDEFHGQFPLQLQPDFRRPDAPALYGANNLYTVGRIGQTTPDSPPAAPGSGPSLAVDSALDLVYNAPLRIPTANLVSGLGSPGGFASAPSLTWTVTADTDADTSVTLSPKDNTSVVAIRNTAAWGASPPTNVWSAEASTGTYGCAGFWVEWACSNGASGDDEPGDQTLMSWKMGDDTIYALLVDGKQGASVWVQRPLEASWYQVGEMPLGGTSIAAQHRLLVLCLNDTVRLAWDWPQLNEQGSAVPPATLVLKRSEAEIVTVGDLPSVPTYTFETWVAALGIAFVNYGHCTIAFHPVRFTEAGWMVSNEQQLGFEPRLDTPPSYEVEYYKTLADEAAINAIAATWFLQGSELMYLLTLSGASTLDPAVVYWLAGQEVATTLYPVCVKRVNIIIAGITVFGWSAPSFIRPTEIEETLFLDYNSWIIQAQGSATFNNRTGTWAGSAGHKALELYLGYESTGLYRRGVYIAGTEVRMSHGATADSHLATVSLASRMQQLADNRQRVIPWMDGWCVWYALRTLLQLGGIPDASVSPDVPWCDDPYCLNLDHYHLPVGTGASPLVSFPLGSSALEAMQTLRRYVGALMYFDRNGFFHFDDWVRPALVPAIRRFSPVRALTWDAADPLNQALAPLQLRASVAAVRNMVAIIGVEIYNTWKPIVTSLRDDGSIVDAPWSENFIGYPTAAVQVEPSYATPAYNAAVATSMFAILRQPQIEVTLRTFMQPDIYPGDIVELADDRFGTVGLPFRVVGISNTLNRQRQPYAEITARWVPPATEAELDLWAL